MRATISLMRSLKHSTKSYQPQVFPSKYFPSTFYRRHASVSAALLQFGQPVHETHPHLLEPGEITPGITALEYSNRRSKLAKCMSENSMAILASSNIKYRSGVVFYEFHQDSNFFYLTGFNEPDSVAVIQKVGASAEYIFHLFLRPKDAIAEQWNGARSGKQAAIDIFNADKSGDINDLNSLLPTLISEANEVYIDVTRCNTTGLPTGSQTRPVNHLEKIIKSHKVRPLGEIMNDLRIRKSNAEIRNMRIAGNASGKTITNAMRLQWTKEKDLGAFLDYEFKINGCDTTAYFPVVAGGRNALSIHYVRNDALLQDKQTVLVDAGGEYGGYITDITRTWPINGKFSDAQKDLYEAILSVQRNCVSLCRESADMSLDALHKIAEEGLTENLRQLGFNMGKEAIRTLFPHHLSHYIGLDVHDCSGYSRSICLKTGHCVTVEPGIYVPLDDNRWPKHFRGMGMRIEDSVCVQENSPLVLTTEAVKEVVDIEALRG